MNPTEGYVITTNNMSPLYMMKSSSTLHEGLSPEQYLEALPKNSYWSDIIWAQ